MIEKYLILSIQSIEDVIRPPQQPINFKQNNFHAFTDRHRHMIVKIRFHCNLRVFFKLVQ